MGQDGSVIIAGGTVTSSVPRDIKISGDGEDLEWHHENVRQNVEIRASRWLILHR